MKSLSLILPYVEHFHKANSSLVHETWINISKYYNLFYPALDTVFSLNPNIDVTNEAFYYEADSKHNPDKEVKFFSIHKESWAVKFGQLGSYLSPIYLKDEFIGVLGVSITVNKLAQIFSKMSLPFNSYVMLIDNQNRVLISSNESKSSFDFDSVSFYANHLSLLDGEGAFPLEPIDGKLFSDKNKMIVQKNIKNSEYRVVFVADNKEIYGDIEKRFANQKQVDIYITIGIFILYILYFLFMFISIKTLALRISNPLKRMVDFSKELGTMTSHTPVTSNIKELETLNNSFVKTNERLMHLINYDATTGIYNHRKLREDLSNKNTELSLVLFRLENFKKYYNLFGPEIGKQILLAMVSIFQKSTLFNGTLYRENKDTIALLMSEDKGPLKVKEISLNILDEITSNSMTIEGIDISLAIKIGATTGIINDDIDMLAQADIALSNSLSSSNTDFTLYSEVSDSKDKYKENMMWSKHTKEALDDYRIIAFFQPIYSYKTNKIEKFEALVRMILDDKIISPFKFLDAAKSIGKLHEITKTMVEQVFIMSIKYPNVEFSINTSFEDFEGGKLLYFVKEKLKEYRVSPNSIIFEILETDTFTDENFIVDTIKELKNLGFKIAIDDFGTGHSNFSHITLMDVDFIKIDGMFVKDLVTNELNRKMVKTMVSFAKEIDAKTIAEFVHSEAVFDIANELNVDYAQGYYKSPPISEEEVEEILKKQ